MMESSGFGSTQRKIGKELVDVRIAFVALGNERDFSVIVGEMPA